jgi:hypothetical protein
MLDAGDSGGMSSRSVDMLKWKLGWRFCMFTPVLKHAARRRSGPRFEEPGAKKWADLQRSPDNGLMYTLAEGVAHFQCFCFQNLFWAKFWFFGGARPLF